MTCECGAHRNLGILTFRRHATLIILMIPWLLDIIIGSDHHSRTVNKTCGLKDDSQQCNLSLLNGNIKFLMSVWEYQYLEKGTQGNWKTKQCSKWGLAVFYSHILQGPSQGKDFRSTARKVYSLVSTWWCRNGGDAEYFVTVAMCFSALVLRASLVFQCPVVNTTWRRKFQFRTMPLATSTAMDSQWEL